MHHSKVIILGSGPAGCTAAIYAARAMLEPCLISGIQPGGQLTITTDVENYPGFADVIQGPWLMEQMQQQAEHVGTRIIVDLIEKLDLGQRPFAAVGDSGDLKIPGDDSDALLVLALHQRAGIDGTAGNDRVDPLAGESDNDAAQVGAADPQLVELDLAEALAVGSELGVA